LVPKSHRKVKQREKEKVFMRRMEAKYGYLSVSPSIPTKQGKRK